MWAYGTGAGWPGRIVVGLLAAGLMLGVGQFLFAFARPVWLRLTIGLVFAAPAAVAGYHAVHGIAKHAMPSETWQFIFRSEEHTSELQSLMRTSYAVFCLKQKKMC